MKTIQIKDKTFVPYLSKEEIAEGVKRIARQIDTDLADKTPLFICILNGAFIFAADLMRSITIEGQISFIRIKTYSGTQSTENIKEISGLDVDIKDRTIVLIEDVVDSGFTICELKKILQKQSPAGIKVATLMFKPHAMRCKTTIDYAAFEIPNDFIIGYGMDYDEKGRNLDAIYVIKED